MAQQSDGALMKDVSRTRLVIAAVGLAGIGYGLWLILRFQPISKPFKLIEWLAGAVILHDGVLVPTTLLIGGVLTAVIPPRARRYIQGGLIASALVTIVALALIYREGDQEKPLALLQQNYAAHLVLVVAIIVGITAVAYCVRVVRDRTQAANVRPAADQVSVTE
jgi:hypothetical protein